MQDANGNFALKKKEQTPMMGNQLMLSSVSDTSADVSRGCVRGAHGRLSSTAWSPVLSVSIGHTPCSCPSGFARHPQWHMSLGIAIMAFCIIHVKTVLHGLTQAQKAFARLFQGCA